MAENARAINDEGADAARVPEVHVGAAESGAPDVDESFCWRWRRDFGFAEGELVVGCYMEGGVAEEGEFLDEVC